MTQETKTPVLLAGVDPTRVRPYGDAVDDGWVQVSFSLPVPLGPEGREAARRLVSQMGLQEPSVYHEADLGHGFSFFILYGKCRHTVDYSRIVVPKVVAHELTMHEVDDLVRERLGRQITVVGACTGTDAHTVGIDAILNMKGFDGEYGLERYTMFETFNMGSQVSNESLLQKIRETGADAALVSQVVTQKDVHLSNLAEFVDMVEAAGLRERLVMVCGGPRISHEVALELGYDGGFGTGTRPNRVAAFIAQEVIRRAG
jgi:beta-lysine 5,6-aminomutase beta subunit